MIKMHMKKQFNINDDVKLKSENIEITIGKDLIVLKPGIQGKVTDINHDGTYTVLWDMGAFSLYRKMFLSSIEKSWHIINNVTIN